MNYLLLIAAAIAPAVAIIVFIYYKDKYEKEPLSLLIKCFLLGVLSVIPAIILESIGSVLGFGTSVDIVITLIHAFVVVALSEEFSKYIFLRYYAYKQKAFNEPFDGIICALMISMGFATTENIMYVLDNGMGNALSRAFTAVPMHACFAVLMGFYVGAAKFSFKKNKKKFLLTGLAYATFLHGLYDFLLMQQNYRYLYLFAFVLVIFAVIMAMRAIKIQQRFSPFKEWKIKKGESNDE